MSLQQHEATETEEAARRCSECRGPISRYSNDAAYCALCREAHNAADLLDDPTLLQLRRSRVVAEIVATAHLHPTPHTFLADLGQATAQLAVAHRLSPPANFAELWPAWA